MLLWNTAMMRAQLCQVGDDPVVQVCGRLAADWVPELERCWRAARKSYPHGALSVDLRGVTFIDQAGEDLLKRMHHEGASFVTSGLVIPEVVKQVKGGVK
jgi:anti-anti-sigma regulatory factor